MRLEALTRVDRGDGPRVEARVVWEGPHRGPETMWFETDAAFGDDLVAAPEAFALAAMPLACGLGEPRLAVEGTLCTRLRTGLASSMTLLSTWYPTCRVVPVEATQGFVARRPRAERRAGLFLSGGIDSLSLLRANRLAFPADHPSSFREAIFLFGWHTQDLDGDAPRPARRRANDEQRARLERLGASTGLTVLPVRSNVRRFHPTYAFTKDQGFGAGMIAAAHLFPGRFTEVAYASHGHGPEAKPHASHVALDPNHASGAVEVRFGEPFAYRMEKLRAVAAWPEALDALQTCLMFDELPPGEANCGRCEKCRRTLLALLACDALDGARTFPRLETPAQLAAAYRPSGAQQFAYAHQVADALEARGRGDLATTLRRKVGRAARKEGRRRWRRRLASLWRRRP